MNEAVLMGTLFVIAAPSGAGKTSLVNALVERVPNLNISISYTTRRPRENETHGEHYFFVSPEEFAVMEAQNVFLEHAAVFGHAYGTSRQWVEEKLKAGSDVILEIDWQGAKQIRYIYPESVSIFILPPSIEALAERLRGRGQDTESVIEARLAKAVREMEHCPDFDYIVINDDFEKAVVELESIVRSRHLITAQQMARYAELLANLLPIEHNKA